MLCMLGCVAEPRTAPVRCCGRANRRHSAPCCSAVPPYIHCPAGAPEPLLTDINLSLPPNQLGLVFGRSGSGKTTLLQLVAGLAQPSSGTIGFSGPAAAAAVAAAQANGSAAGPSNALSSEARMAQVRPSCAG